MRKYQKIMFLILMFCMCCVSFFGIIPKEVFADQTTHTVVFDFNTQRIEKYIGKDNSELLNSLKTYSKSVEHGKTAFEDRKPNISTYTYEWTVNNVVVDINNYAIVKDTRFVALWTPKKCKVSFKFDADPEKDSEIRKEITNLSQFENFEFTVESSRIMLPRPKREGYNFGGWYYADSNIVQLDIPAGSFGDKVFIARFSLVEYFIDYHFFDAKDVKNDFNPTHYNVGNDMIYLNSPSAYGHIFRGWYSDKGFKNKIEFIDTSNGGNLDIYALWELEKYNVTYILPNGIQKVVEVEYGKTAPLPDIEKNIFQIVKTDVSRNNITKDTTIIVSFVNITYVYIIVLLLIAGAVVTIVLVRKKRENTHNKLRLVYKSNSSKKR